MFSSRALSGVDMILYFFNKPLSFICEQTVSPFPSVCRDFVPSLTSSNLCISSYHLHKVVLYSVFLRMVSIRQLFFLVHFPESICAIFSAHLNFIVIRQLDSSQSGLRKEIIFQDHILRLYHLLKISNQIKEEYAFSFYLQKALK